MTRTLEEQAERREMYAAELLYALIPEQIGPWIKEHPEEERHDPKSNGQAYSDAFLAHVDAIAARYALRAYPDDDLDDGDE